MNISRSIKAFSLIAAMTLLGPVQAMAAEVTHLTVHVKGMVCAFCAQGLKKSFSKEKSVEKFDVSLEDKTVKLDLKPNESLSDDQIKKIITEAGFAIEKIDRVTMNH